MILASVELPIKAENPNNFGQGHAWIVTAKRRKAERSLVALWFLSSEARMVRAWDRSPLTVTFTRIAYSAGLDDDALPVTCKSIRDEVAKQLGVSDGPRGPVKWRYDQERGPRPKYFAVRVTFEVEEKVRAA